MWNDPDVRWLSGVHTAEGHDYLVRETYEELLWWLAFPSLLRLGCEDVPSRTAVEQLSRTIEDALAKAEAAGYRLDLLIDPGSAAHPPRPQSVPVALGATEKEIDPQAVVPGQVQAESEQPEPKVFEAQEPVISAPPASETKPEEPA